MALAVALAAAACGPEAGSTCGDDSICLANGPCLGEAIVIETDVAALHLVAADLDADARIDVLAIGTREDGSVAAELHAGHGDGSFADPVAIAATGCSAYPLAGDLDGDGVADLVYPDCEGALLVFWGGPGGPAQTPTSVALPFVMTGSSIADMDGDGIDDLVVVGHATDVGQLGWVRGAGDRALALVGAVALDGLAFVPSAVRSGDVDGDGHPDAFAFTPGVADALALATGRGADGFAAAQTMPVGRIGQITLGAFGAASPGADLLVAAPQDMRLSVAAIAGGAPSVTPTPVFPYRPAQASAVQWDGDPGDEAVVVDGFDPEVRWFAFADDGSADERGRIPTPHAAQIVLVPDVDGDGTADLLVGHFAQAAFSLRLSSEGSG